MVDVVSVPSSRRTSVGSHAYTGVSFSDPFIRDGAREGPMDAAGDRLLRRPLLRRRPKSTFRVVAFGTVLSLAVVYLLLRCVMHLSSRYSVGEHSRRLAQGGGPPLPGFCVKEDSDDEDALRRGARRRTTTRHPGAPALEASPLQQQMVQLARGRRPQTANALCLLQTVMLKIERGCRWTERLASILTCRQGFLLVRIVVRLAVLDLSCFVFQPNTLEHRRQALHTFLIGMLHTYRNRVWTDKTQEIEQWIDQMLILLEQLRETPMPDPPLQGVRGTGFMTSIILLANRSSAYLHHSLSRLSYSIKKIKKRKRTASKVVLPPDILEPDLHRLDSIRRVRAQQVLKVANLRHWLSRCQKLTEGWPLFTHEELSTRFNLPSFEAQIEDIRLAALEAGDGSPASQQSLQSDAKGQWSVPGEEALGPVAPGAGLAELETTPHVVTPPELGKSVRTLYVELFAVLGSIAETMTTLNGLLDDYARLECTRLVLKLVAVELGAASALSNSLQPQRQSATARFIVSASNVLTQTPTATGSPAAAEIMDLLKLLERIHEPLDLTYEPVTSRYLDAMSHQAECSLVSSRYLLSILERLVDYASIMQTAVVTRHLKLLEQLANLRATQCRRRAFLMHSLLVAQKKANVQVLFPYESLRDLGDPTTSGIVSEILEVISSAQIPVSSELQHEAPPGTLQAAELGAPGAASRTRMPQAAWPSPGAAMPLHREQYVAYDASQEGVWAPTRGSLHSAVASSGRLPGENVGPAGSLSDPRIWQPLGGRSAALDRPPGPLQAAELGAPGASSRMRMPQAAWPSPGAAAPLVREQYLAYGASQEGAWATGERSHSAVAPYGRLPGEHVGPPGPLSGSQIQQPRGGQSAASGAGWGPFAATGGDREVDDPRQADTMDQLLLELSRIYLGDWGPQEDE